MSTPDDVQSKKSNDILSELLEIAKRMAELSEEMSVSTKAHLSNIISKKLDNNENSSFDLIN